MAFVRYYWGTGCCSLIENKTSQQYNKNNRTTDQGQHTSDRQSEEEEGFSILIWLQVKPGSSKRSIASVIYSISVGLSLAVLDQYCKILHYEQYGINELMNRGFSICIWPRAHTTHHRRKKKWEKGGGRNDAGKERVRDMVWLPLIWLLSILPSCILPMMETYKTITTKITKADKSTNYHHRDNTHTQWEPKTTNKETGKWLLIQPLCDSHIERLVLCKWCDVTSSYTYCQRARKIKFNWELL